MINIDRIIEQSGLDSEEIAVKLFPNLAHPRKALQRVLNGESKLDSDQIAKLSSLTNIPIQDLFNDTWKSRSSNGIITFTKGDYLVCLDNDSNITRIYKKGASFHESILHNGAISVKDYLKTVDDIIEKHKLNK